ncbi:MAG: hypothetical protein HN576_13770 [Bacteriovoracaceae bacterium]|jgi:hypothetical protein|nr:hypothetical protein [Bacteriovoracaceae bacterium]
MNKDFLLRAAFAGLLLGVSSCSQLIQSNDDHIGHCHGVNTCKSKSECGGKVHGCAGLNQCKGKGWVRKSETECTELKGSFEG